MEPILFVEYPKCSTCKKAKKWLDEHGIEYTDRDIVKDNPQAPELKEWHEKSGLPVKRFFNTCGKLYREQNIKEKLENGLSNDECYEMLSEDGMMIKRPIIVGEDFAFTGFKEAEWEKVLL